jgi:hypothetical protein
MSSSGVLEILGICVLVTGFFGYMIAFGVLTADWNYWVGCVKEYMRRMKLRQKIAELPLSELEIIDATLKRGDM